jgi:hypothetical protein
MYFKIDNLFKGHRAALDHIIKPFTNLIVECWSFVQLYLSKDPRFKFFFAD